MALRISLSVLSIALVLVGTSAFYGDRERRISVSVFISLWHAYPCLIYFHAFKRWKVRCLLSFLPPFLLVSWWTLIFRKTSRFHWFSFISFVCWEIFSKASVRSLGVLNINLFDRLLIYLTFGIFPPEHTVSFGYNGDTGPGNWGNLSPHYETCSNGKWQSPVDIVKEKVVRNKSLKPLIRDYSPANATLINHGFNIAVCSCSWTSK